MKAQEGYQMHSGDVLAVLDIPAPHDTPKTAHKPVSFHVPGAVVGKGRARIGKVGAHARMFTPEKTVSYENLVKTLAYDAMGKTGDAGPYAGPLQANLLIGVAIPATFSKKKRDQALAGEIYPTTKPDLDNCIKSVFDAMNGVVYADDKQIVTTVCKKRYREAPGLWVTVFAIGETT